jgi:ribokinase
MTMTIEVVGNTAADVCVEVEQFPGGTDAEFGPSSLAMAGNPARLDVGGNAGRTARLLAALGNRVRLHTALGADAWGDWLESELRDAGVQLVRPRSGHSATNCIATNSQGHRLSFFYPGETDYGDPAPRPDTAFLIISACPPPDGSDLASWLPAFADAGIPVLADLGPMLQDVDVAGLGRLAGADFYLTMNERELVEMTGATEVRLGIAELHEKNFGRIVVKLGARGALVSTPQLATAREVPTKPLPPRLRSTVGAGDCFNAGFVHALIAGANPCRAAELGNEAACRALGDHDSAASEHADTRSVATNTQRKGDSR